MASLSAATAAAPALEGRRPRARASWIQGPIADTAVATCWVPFAVVAHLVEGRSSLLGLLLQGLLLFSFAHQPLTLALVYGSPWRFASHRKLFLWSPPAFLAAVLVGTHVSLALVAVVAGLWNIEHTLMQRYGIMRIYGRKAGDDQGRLERALLIAGLVATVLWIAAQPSSPQMLDRVDLGSVSQTGVALLLRLAPAARILVVPALLVAAGLIAAWWRAERRRGPEANRAKHLYVGATLVLMAVMVVDPLAGFVGYVGAHAVEYVTVVNRSLRIEPERPGPLGRAVTGRGGRLRFLVAYGLAVAALVAGLDRLATPEGLTVCLLTLGGLHVFYDAFIWKLRRPAVAAGLVSQAAG
ncbi:MAG: hypothetical protein ACRDYD_05140 [Acidimicrobiales bacterium]